MKAESTALAGQRETISHEEKESAETDLEFSSWFFVEILTCSFADFIFTGSRML